MLRMLVIIGIGAGAVVVVFAAAFLLGMRSKSRMVIDAVRRFNRGFTNPRVLRSAGEPGASASVAHHVGRTSGAHRETPIGAMPVEGGFLIALPYGTRADWVQNVLATGSATIVHEGVTSPVGGPTIVPTASVARLFPASERRLLRIFNVESCLRVSTERP